MSCAIVSSVPTKESDEDENGREEYDKNGHLMTATIWIEGQINFWRIHLPEIAACD